MPQSLRSMADRMITDVLTQPDAALEGSLRPGVFADFTGQLKVKERLGIAMEAAKQRGEALDVGFEIALVCPGHRLEVESGIPSVAA